MTEPTRDELRTLLAMAEAAEPGPWAIDRDLGAALVRKALRVDAAEAVVAAAREFDAQPTVAGFVDESEAWRQAEFDLGVALQTYDALRTPEHDAEAYISKNMVAADEQGNPLP